MIRLNCVVLLCALVVPYSAAAATAEMKFLVRDSGPEGPLTEAQLDRGLHQAVAMIQSEELVRDALNRPLAQDTAWFQSFNGDLTAARQDFGQRLSVEMDRAASLVVVRLVVDHPDDATTLLHELSAAYLTRNQLNYEISATGMRKLLISEANRARDDVGQHKQKMDRFYAENKFTPPALYGDLWVDLKRQYIDLGVQLNVLKKSKAASDDSDTTLDAEIDRVTQQLHALLPEIEEVAKSLVRAQQQEEILETYRHDLAVAQARLDWANQELDGLRVRANREDAIGVLLFTDPSVVDVDAAKPQAVELRASPRVTMDN